MLGGSQVKKGDESDRMRADFEKMKATEVEELTEAFKAVKTQMATELEANVDIKEKLETDLTTTKHSLLDIKHQLNMAEKVSHNVIYYIDLLSIIKSSNYSATKL